MRLRASTFRSPWAFVYLAVAAVISLLCWTVWRPYMVITDGMPTATDPLTPLGVFFVNGVLVCLAWAVVCFIHVLWFLGRGLSRFVSRGRSAVESAQKAPTR